MKVGITFDLRQEYLLLGYSLEDTVELDRDDTVDAIEGVLRGLGFQVDRIGNVRRLVERLASGDRWDLVFNIAEGLKGFGREAQVPALLEAYGIPCTFSDSLVCALALHKGLTNQVVRGDGIPTADFRIVSSEEELFDVNLPFPLFLKPVAEGTSKGVSARNRVEDPAQLLEVGRRLLYTYRQPVLVETYLPGREFTVGLIGTGPKARAIGAMEVVLLDRAEQGAYSYDNKAYYEDRVEYRLGDPSDPEVAEALDVAVRAWRALGCRDAGRVDLRSGADGHPRFLEVNPLAGLNPDISDLPILCRLAGVPYRDLIAGIVQSALDRVPDTAARGIVLPVPAIGLPGSDPLARQGDLFLTPTPASAYRGRPRPKVLFLHERIEHGAPADRQDLRNEMEYLAGILRNLGYDVATHPISLDLRSVSRAVQRIRPDVVFNLAETVDGQGRLVHFAPAILDRLGVPYTGNGTEAMFLTSNKLVAKEVMRQAGIPTPRAATLEQVLHGDVDLSLPCIIKSVWEEASVGLDEDSVIRDRERLKDELLRRLPELGGAGFVEEYVDGREFNLSLLSAPGGPRVLPVAEMRFVDWPEGKERVVGYRAKWDPDSFEYGHTVRSFAIEAADEPLVRRLVMIALRCWERFGLRGYARVDFRVSPDGSPTVLEINANPCLSPDGGFMAAAREALLSPEQVLTLILADLNRPRPSAAIPITSSRMRRTSALSTASSATRSQILQGRKPRSL